MSFILNYLNRKRAFTDPNRKKYTLHSQTRSAATSPPQLEERRLPFWPATNPANRQFCSLANKPFSLECLLSSTEVTLVLLLVTYFLVLPYLA